MISRLLRCCTAFLVVMAVVITVSCSPDDPRVACTGHAGLVSDGTLTVAADYSYPPFAYRGPEGDLVGFDVDVVEAIASRLELEPRFVNRGAGQLVPGALAHRHDIAASGLRLTASLGNEMCVSDGYLDADLGVLVAAPNPLEITTVSALKDKTVGVLDGSEAEIWATRRLSTSTVASLPTIDDLLTALRQGEIDAVVEDLPVARFAAKESKDFRVGVRVPTDDEFVLVAAPDNADLIDRINDALAALRKNGALRRIERKWLGA